MAEKEKQEHDIKEEKPKKKRKGCCLWIFLAFVAVIALIVAMPVFKICPPPGPWPTPPWCYDKDDCTSYPGSPFDGLIRKLSDSIGATGLKVGNACMIMRSYGKNTFVPYGYKELSYITGTENYTTTERELTFDVGIADYWGNPYVFPKSIAKNIPQFIQDHWFTLGEDTRKSGNLENTTKRVSQLGAHRIYFFDFIQLTTDGTLDLFRKDEPAVESMTQDELTRIASEALDNGLQPILSLTIMDPVFGDRLADYFNSGEYGSLYDYESPLQQYDPFNAGENTLTLHEHWRQAILEEARMAEIAGFTGLFITPQGGGWINTGEFIAQDNEEWKKTIAEVRKVFSGKLGVDISRLYTVSSEYDYYKALDFVVVDVAVESVLTGTDYDLDKITAAWKTYLLDPQFEKVRGIDEVIQKLLINSYTGFNDKGWIDAASGHYPDLVRDDAEQALDYEGFLRALYDTPDSPITGLVTWGYAWTDYVYPNIHDLRTDITNSIRDKDAEHVFHRWQTIFK